MRPAATDTRNLITQKDIIDHYEQVVSVVEEPSYNATYSAYWLLAKEAAKENVVMLGGDGGDEIFLGYKRFKDTANVLGRYASWGRYPAKIYDTIRAILDHRISLGESIDLSDPMLLWTWANQMGKLFSNPVYRITEAPNLLQLKVIIENILRPEGLLLNNDTQNTLGALDAYFRLPSEDLLRGDKIAMTYGIEGRFPMLDQSLVQRMRSVPSSQKLEGGLKGMLRSSYRGILPDYIIDKPKSGWNAPVSDWMGGAFGDFAREVLSSQYYPETAKLFDLDLIRERYVQKGAVAEGTPHIFTPIMNFQIWARNFGVKMD